MCRAKKISPDEVRRLIAPHWGFREFARHIVEIYRLNEERLREYGLDVDGMLADLEMQLDEVDTGSNVWRTVLIVHDARRLSERELRDRFRAVKAARLGLRPRTSCRLHRAHRRADKIRWDELRDDIVADDGLG